MGSRGNKNLRDVIYSTYQRELQTFSELPSDKVEFMLGVKKNVKEMLLNLINDFKIYDMEVRVESQNSVTVTGYPPDNDFGQQNVLEIVQQHDPHATMISAKKLAL